MSSQLHFDLSFDLKEAEKKLRRQYERFPYPPIPFLALPQHHQGQSIRYETIGKKNHKNIRILVAGGGTFEPLLVAMMHPQASEIIAVDFSQASLKQLEKRIQFFKFVRFYKKLPSIHLVHDTIDSFLKRPIHFNYIIASNMIHHLSNPTHILKLFSKRLKPEGILRLITYPKASRLWMRGTAYFFKEQGLSTQTPQLHKKVLQALQTLPPSHPVRLCFFSHPENQHLSGIIDAFFNPLENPLHPFEWAFWSDQFGLDLYMETQNPTSQSSFLDEIAPELSHFHPWYKLQILDDCLELCTNPILWFKKRPTSTFTHKNPSFFLEKLFQLPATPKNLPFKEELKWNWFRLQTLLDSSSSPLSAKELLYRLKKEVGPRTFTPPSLWNFFPFLQNFNPYQSQWASFKKNNLHSKEILLPGLALSDYELSFLYD